MLIKYKIVYGSDNKFLLNKQKRFYLKFEHITSMSKCNNLLRDTFQSRDIFVQVEKTLFLI